jgi:hypothetical protein
MPRQRVCELDGIAGPGAERRQAAPATDLAVLFRVINRYRAAGLCRRHQHRGLRGYDAVVAWADGRWARGDDRPAAAPWIFTDDD